MKSIIIVMSMLSSVFAFAATENEIHVQSPIAEVILPNINRGNIAVGGSMGVQYQKLSSYELNVSPNAEYFLADRFSLGGTLLGYFSRDYSSLGVGPSFSYYFWNNEKWAASAGGGALFTQIKQTSSYDSSSYTFQSWSAFGKLGLNYFFTPSVALGPQLNVNYSPYSGVTPSLLFQFNVFL